MIICPDCRAAFFTQEGIDAHPCIGYVPAQTIFVKPHSPMGLNARAGDSPHKKVR